MRRPIHSITGQKLCYLEAGPDGETVYSLAGEKIAKLKTRHKKWIEGLTASQTMGGSSVISPSDIWDNMRGLR